LKKLLDSSQADFFQLIQNMGIHVDELNFLYYFSLWHKWKNQSKTLKWYLYPIDSQELNIKDSDNSQAVYSMALIPSIVKEECPIVHYEDLLKSDLTSKKRTVLLWCKKMQAGLGTSIKRQQYLDRLFKKWY